MKHILTIIFCISVSFLIALGGSSAGFIINDNSMIFNCFFIAFGIQFTVFIPSYLFKTERFFDLTGSITFLSIIYYILFNRDISDFNYTGLILISLISIWTLRLGLFLFLRIHHDGKDRRFNELKINFLKFLVVWTLQGFWVFVTSSCAIAVLCSNIIIDNFLFIVVGSAIWILGFAIEVVSDMQKRRFRESNKEQFISSGLWSYSRHPNYLGEILLWLGIAVICLPNLEGAQYITLISPVFVYLLLTRISGINLLEDYAEQKWGKSELYQDYKKATPVLFPFKK